jgi:hypothetical protein
MIRAVEGEDANHLRVIFLECDVGHIESHSAGIHFRALPATPNTAGGQ